MNTKIRLLAVSGLLIAAPRLTWAQAQPTQPTRQTGEGEVVQLDPFTVSAEGDVGYGATYTSGATRINMPVADAAVSVITLNEAFLRDIAPIESLDAMKYVTGVTYSGNPLSGSYTIRGYESTNDFRDGLTEYRGVLPHDPFSTSRIELIKGPEGMLFGSIGVGGVLNRVSKKPQPRDFTELSFSVGSYDFWRAEFDYNRSLAGGKVGFRAGGVLQDAETYAGGAYQRRGLFLHGTWRPSSATTTWARFEYQNPDVAITRSTYFTNDYGQLPTFLPRDLSPDEVWDIDEFDYLSYELGMTHRLTSDWTTRLVLRGATIDNDEQRVIKTRVDFFDRNGVLLGREIASGGRPAVDFRDHANFGSIVMGRQRYQHPNSSRVALVAFDVTGTAHFLGAKHLFLAYLGAEDSRARDKTIISTYPSFNFLNPQWYSDPDLVSTNPNVGTNTLTNETGFNFGIQDNLHFLNDRVIVTAGTRYDYEVSDLQQFVGNVRNNESNHGWSSKFGLVGKPLAGVSLYYNHTGTFLPQAGLDHNNVPFENLEGVMDEVGVKLGLLGGKLTGTISVFESRLKNQIINGDTLPDGQRERFQIGENKTDGWEADIRWQPTPAWSFLVGYGDITSVNQLGIRIRHAPQGQNYQLFTKYVVQKGPIKGAFAGLGYVFTNERAGDNTDTFNLPSYDVFDLLAGYARGRWRFQVNVKNLFDDTYIATGGSARRAVLGEFRNIRVTTGYSF